MHQSYFYRTNHLTPDHAEWEWSMMTLDDLVIITKKLGPVANLASRMERYTNTDADRDYIEMSWRTKRSIERREELEVAA